MNEDREKHKAREHGVNYGMYREIGEIRGREMAESLARVRAAFEGISKGMAAVGAPRKCDEGRLDLDTAYECAMVEYVWRMRQEATLKGRLKWKSKAMDYRNEWHATLGALGDERTARGRAESERDDYKARSVRKSGRILELNANLARAQGDRDEYKARWELRGEAIRELRTDLDRAGHSPECRDKAGRPWYMAADISPAVVTAEALRSERDALWAELERTRRDLEATRKALKAAEESAGRHRARADRIKEANLRLCALREADRTGKDVDDVPTGLRACGLLITPRIRSEIRDVSRCGGGRTIGYLSPYSLGWNAYVYQPNGPAKFVGWYRDVEKAADAIDGSYPR